MLPHAVKVSIIYVRDIFSFEVVYGKRSTALEYTGVAPGLHQGCTGASFILRSQNLLQLGTA